MPTFIEPSCVRIRPHTSAYVRIRQHTDIYCLHISIYMYTNIGLKATIYAYIVAPELLIAISYCVYTHTHTHTHMISIYTYTNIWAEIRGGGAAGVSTKRCVTC